MIYLELPIALNLQPWSMRIRTPDLRMQMFHLFGDRMMTNITSSSSSPVYIRSWMEGMSEKLRRRIERSFTFLSMNDNFTSSCSTSLRDYMICLEKF